ncbi:MAG: response regulator [Desulfobacterales bacterium]|nr:response regulator [Desulfobacterales bacterium]
MFQDLSEKKAKETALREKQVAEAANQAKSEFLANMSHELRSPLNAILGFAQVMERCRAFPAEHQEHLGIIRRSGEHLLVLINQVLDLSKIEAGRTTRHDKNFDLHRLLHDMEDMFALKAEDKNLQLIFERDESVPRYIRADEVKLRQVLINLLSNAVKFTKEGGVTVGVSSIPDCRLGFEIEDTGPGIAPEETDAIFEAFSQSETGKQSQEGIGLGLPISRKFVQLMGGDIQVNSRLGQGTMFSFDLQTQEVKASDIDAPIPVRRVTALEPGQPRYRILIADDLRTSRQLIVRLLSPFGFELREAANGQKAVEIWETWHPHLIWMDMHMPVMNGYEATKKIKSQTTNNKQQIQTVIIALTASSFEEERAAVLQTGCDDYLRKPFREAELFDLMSRHIGVKFVYEKRAKANEESLNDEYEVAPKALSALPAEWLLRLRQGAEETDVEMLLEVTEQIREQDVLLANALMRLAEDFEYNKILACIQDANSI